MNGSLTPHVDVETRSFTDWRADASSRAHTRGVLMALARDREWYFSLPQLRMIVAGVVSLGLLPMLDTSRKFDRWRRLEWTQYAQLAQWMAERSGETGFSTLATAAGANAGPPSLRIATRVSASVALGFLALTAWRGGVDGLLVATFWPGANLVLSAILALGWIVHLLGVFRHSRITRQWIAQLSDAVVAHDSRPIAMSPGPLPIAWLVAGVVIGIAVPWLGLQIVCVALQNHLIDQTQSARWQGVERVLEWMDDMPVEYDIDRLQPDQIAEMLA